MSVPLVDARLARLARATVAIVHGDWDSLCAERRAEDGGDDALATWREMLLQAQLFAGFPRVVEAFERLEEHGGVGTPDPAELAPPPPDGGAALFERIYGAGAGDVRARLASFHPELAACIAQHAYGRILSRPGLSAAQRELLAVAALLASGQERQLASHARGAVRCGASSEDVQDVVRAVQGAVEPERARRGLEVVLRFAGRPTDRPE